MHILNPKQYDRYYPDGVSAELIKKTISFFEEKGKRRIKEDDSKRVWYKDFLDFQKREKLFYTFLTPQQEGDGTTRWDTWRNCGLNEVLGFYGLAYWYTWQVSILGLGPIWMSKNDRLRERAAGFLRDGEIFAFGLSEREHGADIYSTDMILTPNGDGWVANGEKYYIGNGNEAKMVSTFGRFADTNEYAFFVSNFEHKQYELKKNVVDSQNYVANFALRDYPIGKEDILATGTEAWDAALNTINVGKYNLGWASIGMCTHSLYEAINHASRRNLFGKYVTDFPHIKMLFTDAYARLVAMRLFGLRAADYMRAASVTDRRYLLFNPIMKMKVTTQGEEVMNLLWDVIAAKGFEKDTFFEMAARDIRALPKLEGTVHVNMALIVKFMPNYFFNPGEFPTIGQKSDAVNDDFLFHQGATKGLGRIQFHDYRQAYDSVSSPNIEIFKEQIEVFKDFMLSASPSKEQTQDIDFLLSVGELFTLVAYGQLIIENARIYRVEDFVLDQIFDFMVRDFSRFALQLYSKASSTAKQMEVFLRMIRRPEVNPERFAKVWEEKVYALNGVYSMNE